MEVLPTSITIKVNKIPNTMLSNLLILGFRKIARAIIKAGIAINIDAINNKVGLSNLDVPLRRLSTLPGAYNSK